MCRKVVHVKVNLSDAFTSLLLILCVGAIGKINGRPQQRSGDREACRPRRQHDVSNGTSLSSCVECSFRRSVIEVQEI